MKDFPQSRTGIETDVGYSKCGTVQGGDCAEEMSEGEINDLAAGVETDADMPKRKKGY